MNILFSVQGEGRGHLTQALAVKQIVEKHGHHVVSVMVGGRNRRVPDFFLSAFPGRIRCMDSPGFVYKRNRSLSPSGTALRILSGWARHLGALRQLHLEIRRCQPDLLVNFYEPVTGLHQWLHPDGVPSLAIGHQYMLQHDDYTRSGRQAAQQSFMQYWNRLVGAGSHRLALSFYPAPDLPGQRLSVGPPLLREALFESAPREPEDFILVYLLNHGYGTDLLRWHRRHPRIRVHCYCDHPEVYDRGDHSPALAFHRLTGDAFLDAMRRCRAVVCTAGFETVSEAAWLGKPVMMVPVENHVEQELNAKDAERSGIGFHAPDFNLDRLLSDDLRVNDTEGFRRWVARGESIFMKTLHAVTRHCEPAALAGVLNLPPH